MRGLILVALTAGAAAQGAVDPAVAAAMSATKVPGAVDARLSPLDRVIALLKKMQDETRAAKEADAEQYEQMQCWCSTNGEEKAAAIAKSEKAAAGLDAEIAENTAEAEQLEAEIKQTKQQIADNEATLEESTAIRNKENAAFLEKNADLLDALKKLGGAITALKKWNKGDDASFLQLSSSVHAVKPLFKAEMQQDLMEFLAASSPSTRLRGVALQQQMAPGYKSYNSRSGQIFGVLEGLEDQMKRDNQEALDTEAKQKKAFEKLRDAKLSEIEEGKAQVVAKTNQLSETRVALANAKANLKSTFGDLDADRKFVAEMEKTCSTWDSDYEARLETRNQEIAAINEALSILRDNDSRDVFNNSNEVFLQLATDNAALRQRAMAVLKKQGSSQLSALAFGMKLKPLAKVKEAMDKMVSELKQQQKEEFEQHDYCQNALQENQNQRDDANNEKEDLEAEIQSIESDIEKLTTEIADLKTSEKETLVAIKVAGLDRASQSVEYQQTVKNNRMAISILNKVLMRLAKFYAPELIPTAGPAGPAMMQEPGKANDVAKPANFGNYEKSGSAPGVLSMIQKIIADVEQEVSEAVQGDQNAQSDYAEMIRTSTDDLNTNRQSQAQKEGQKAQKESDRAARKGDHAANEEELDGLRKTNQALHTECDYLIKNFDTRQTARAAEMEAIGQAKAILSGANFN